MGGVTTNPRPAMQLVIPRSDILIIGRHCPAGEPVEVSDTTAYLLRAHGLVTLAPAETATAADAPQPETALAPPAAETATAPAPAPRRSTKAKPPAS